MTLFQTMSNFFENDDDVFTGKDHTPLREDAFVKTPEEKIKIIEEKFAEIMHSSLEANESFKIFSETLANLLKR